MLINLEFKLTIFIAVLLPVLYFILGYNILVIWLILTFCSWALFKIFVTNRINKIISEMEKVKKGNMNACVGVNSRDELGLLENSFNSMLNNIVISQNDLNKKMQELYVINEVSQAMCSTFELDELLTLIITFCKDLVKAETVSLMLVDNDKNELSIKMAIGINEIVMKRRMKVGEGISGWVAQHGKPLLIHDIEKDERFKKKSGKKYATKSLLSVPLITKGKVIGVLNVNNKHSNEEFNDNDLNLLTILGSQASTVIENSLLLNESMAKKNIDQQMGIAHEIQMQLLPEKLPKIKDLTISGLSVPAREIGGDYFDVINIEKDNSVVIAIGDVSGKGVPAALVMIMIRSFLKIEARNNISPLKVLTEVNNLVVSDNKAYSDLFVTLFYGVINKESYLLTYTNAGHDPVYLFHRNNGTFETLKTGDLVLGIFKEAKYHEKTIQLQKGDLLILYTDGVVEASNNKHELFGEERFIRTIFRNIKKSAEGIKYSIYSEVKRFSGDKIQSDDIALLVLDVNYNPEIDLPSLGINKYNFQDILVLTFMDKWYSDVMRNVTPRIIDAMKEKNMIPRNMEFKIEEQENLFYKRSLEDMPTEQDKEVKILKINLRAVMDYIFAIDIINEELGKIAGFDEDVISEWMVGVKESVINAISYGTDFDKDEWIGIYYNKTPDKLIVTVRDHGKGFDLNKIKNPHEQNTVFSDHGRGLLLIRGFMDEVKFNISVDKGTEVVMIKYLPCHPNYNKPLDI